MIHGKRIVALCTYGIYDPQEFGFISELNELLKTQDTRLFIYAMNIEIGNGGDFYIAETSVYDLIPFDKVDTVVIMAEKIKSRDVTQHIIDMAKENHVPTIVIDGDFKDVSLVKFNYAAGFESVVRHIIEDHKPKRPHFMAGKRNNVFSDERLEVFKKVLAENNISFDDSMVSYGDFWSVPSRAAATELLKRDDLPDAVICANDIMAINVCDIFTSAGVKIPEDVVISGFDGIDEAFISSPGITTAICDSHTLAGTLHEAITSALAGEPDRDRWIVPKFVANESCGCPRCDLATLSVVHEMNNRFYHHQDDLHIMQNLTAIMMGCKTVDECAYHIGNSFTDNICVVMEDACLDVQRNYFLEDVENTTKSVLYNVYNPKDRVIPYDEDGIIPNLKELLDRGYPLIFNVLEFMGKSMGFICFSYEKYNLIDYSKTASLTNCVSMGLGGFLILQYQNYLREEIRRMYQNDALTGLYNRVAFLNKLDELKKNEKLKGSLITVIMADLNGLKLINDTRGHAAGDQAIAAVAHALKSSCPEGTVCVRFGGDEMLAMIVGNIEGSAVIARMNDQLEKDSKLLGFEVSASIGCYAEEYEDSSVLEKLIALADEEMYKMKKIKKEACK